LETFEVIFQIIRCHIPEDCSPNIDSSKHLTSQVKYYLWVGITFEM